MRNYLSIQLVIVVIKNILIQRLNFSISSTAKAYCAWGHLKLFIKANDNIIWRPDTSVSSAANITAQAHPELFIEANNNSSNKKIPHPNIGCLDN